MVAYRSVSSNSGSAGTTLSVTKPSGTVSTDVLLAVQSAFSLAEMTTPTGGATWTLLDQQTGGGAGTTAKLWIKEAGGSEPASYTFNKGNTNTTSVIIVAIQSGGAGTAVFASLNTGTTTTANTPGVDPTGTADLEIRIVAGFESV